ncbi:alpha-glucosidase [Enemella evansiae]|uniref:Alpha-glucosidase n=1 Tax=Enemella evansiae TaxID=2016499 RepID=A0A255FYI8_9ACTN|nr:alpha-amylase family glycosyl hydrolase [Enemella evansiae]OYO08715.1 alpha-glucosidase [Enemella evansiae]
MTQQTATPDQSAADWWRSAVVYQIYPRSFADANGDGTGDLRGIIDRLDHLVELGIDALWISPWYPSPLADGGYDVADYRDIHPDFGDLADADELITKAHQHGLRVLIDLVPNHCSDEHPWFAEALAAEPGSPERELFWFRDGRGDAGSEPPTNWEALFGGSTWQRVLDSDNHPGQFYLHLFDVKQPDWNWDNPKVADEFDDILRFWFDRGVDGFRIDVADSMAKDGSLPDLPLNKHTGFGISKDKFPGAPLWDVHPQLEQIHRRWRGVADEYADSEQGARVFVSEAYLEPVERLVSYVEPGRLHSTFNFDHLLSEWSAESLHNVITRSLRAHQQVGAPATWVLSNHDTPRVATRYGKAETGSRFERDGVAPEHRGREWQHYTQFETDLALGRRRARAAALLELALPGGCYVYQGDELGLDEVEDLPAEVLQDPTWERSGHTVKGRDGCRVPIPWSGSQSPFGFGPSGTPWLPQPAHWSSLSVAAQTDDPGSHLNLYRTALAERRRNPALGDGDLTWREGEHTDLLVFDREPGFRCMVNFGAPVALPEGAEVLVHSGEAASGKLGTDEAVWLKV